MVKFGREITGHLDALLRREWLVTNGIGGYAMGSLAGARTRRYHGLLIAALACPASAKPVPRDPRTMESGRVTAVTDRRPERLGELIRRVQAQDRLLVDVLGLPEAQHAQPVRV